MKVNYNCKDNDVKLQFHCEDGKIDEVWVQVDGEKSWTVVGYDDFLNGVKKAEKKCKLKDSHYFGGGYIKQKAIQNVIDFEKPQVLTQNKLNQ